MGLLRWIKQFVKPIPRTEGVKKKSLVAVAVGQAGKPFAKKLVERFGQEQFDFVWFIYDDAVLDESWFSGHRQIREPGLLKYGFAKQHLHPDWVDAYEYLFFWDDDIDVGHTFYPIPYLEIVRTYGIALSQPALTRDSDYSYKALCQMSGERGRYTDFVEIMVPVFTASAWRRFWSIMVSDYNKAGWGYDQVAFCACGFAKMAIIDAQPVWHTRPLSRVTREVWLDFNRYLLSCPWPWVGGPTAMVGIEKIPEEVLQREIRKHRLKKWCHYLKYQIHQRFCDFYR